MVLGAKRLAEDIVNSGRIADRSNRTAGDDSGTGTAGFSRTLAPLYFPMISCGIVEFFIGI